MGKTGLINNYLRLALVLHLSIATTFAQLITLDKGGNVGVNFAGFSAGAGLGGLVNGNAADGGLHAYARTPYGQNAAAGLGGNVKDDGTSTGVLFANAEAGGRVGAGAGLGGTVSKTKTVISSETDAVPVYKYVTKQVQVPAASSLEINKQIAVNQPVHVPEPEIVNPSYVAPVHIEKTVYRRPHLRRKYAYVNTRFNSGEVYAPPPPKVVKVVNVERNAQPVDTNYSSSNTFVSNVSVNKNGNLFNDIFNIPISTLKAVNQLVNNIVGGFTVSKEVTARGHVGAGAGAGAGTVTGAGAGTVTGAEAGVSVGAATGAGASSGAATDTGGSVNIYKVKTIN